MDWNFFTSAAIRLDNSHTLRGCVDWNTVNAANLQPVSTSHPSWVCGLKLHRDIVARWRQQSHPSWVCGLKLGDADNDIFQIASHPSWVCGLKQPILNKRKKAAQVTPFVGVWIETLHPGGVLIYGVSHPSWVCGLKHNFNNLIICQFRSWWFYIHYQQRNWQNRAIFLYLTPKLSGISGKIFKFAFKYNIL